MKFLWKQGKHSEAASLRPRAIEMLKNDLSKLENFEFKFTLLKNDCGMLEEVKTEIVDF